MKNTATVLSINAAIFGIGTLITTSLGGTLHFFQSSIGGLVICGLMSIFAGLTLTNLAKERLSE